MKTLLMMFFSLTLFSCAVNDPLNQQSVVDDRPRLTFSVSDHRPANYDLYIDGIAYGSLEKMTSNTAAIRIIPGRHEVIVKKGAKIVYSKTAYFGEGTLTIVEVIEP